MAFNPLPKTPFVWKNVEKLAKVVEDGNCYGAQQMYKSISARYISAERYSEALDLLHSGACLQLEHGQVTCGAELSVLFVETLVKGKFPYDDDRVRKILKKFPQIPVPQHLDLTDDDDMQKLSEALGEAKIRVEGCSSFLKAAIKWSAEFGAHRNGSLELHDMLAEYIYSESPEVRDALPLFNVLTQTYKSAIDREPVFYELLEEIAGIFYGVQRRNPMQGMFGDFFKMMGGDGM
ncbi:hypothetical protein HYC85_000717 [Camellia sinensis]|uniref:Golgi to ER traffic protein 4 homolog n=1 Tax=Camellia sinensis TaxID=4442 RepID=A0A7J7I5V0_CAMSI|nr:hypothetical protein HYC85_000717 [Camellia sinensis]